MTSPTAPIADGDKDNPQSRAQWFRKGRNAPPGQTAAELRYRAHLQKMGMRAMRVQAASAQAITPYAASTGWTALGPAPLSSDPGTGQDYSWVSGRATSVLIDPADNTGNTVYVGGAFGGLWRSTNAAATSGSSVQWTPMIDNQATLAVGAIALQPGNANTTTKLSNVILVGTGEANSSGDSYYGLGFLRSADAGATWSLISTANSGAYSFKGLSFSKIAFSSTATNVVVAGAAASFPGEQEGADTLTSPTAPHGVYYSTDAGLTWNYANVQDPGGPVVPVSATAVIYNSATGMFYAAIRRHGFYSSSNGINWTRLAQQPGSPGLLSTTNCPNNTNSSNCGIYRGEFAVVPGRNEMYVWFMDLTATSEVDQGIWKTTNGGSSWTAISTSGIESCGDPGNNGCGVQQGEYNLELAAVPNGSTATDLYAGAINIYKCSINSTNPTCATNPFMNLTHVYGCLQIANVHPDQHGLDSMIVNPTQNVMYFANDGGIYRALNGYTGLTTGTCNTGPNQFDSLNQTIGSMTEFVSFSQDSTNPATLLGGTQDNGSPATNQATTSTSWINVNGGDGGYNEINPNNTSEWFTANTDVSIQRCTSGINCNGNTFVQVIGNPQVGGDTGPFYTPYMLDPQSTSEMLVGTCRVWRGTSQGANFTALSFDFDTDTATTCTGAEINQVRSLAAGGPKDANGFSNFIYVGTDGLGPVLGGQGGELWLTTNAAAGPSTFQNLSGSISNGSHYPVSAVAIDSSDASGGTAYAGIMGFGGAHVVRITNGGGSVVDFTGNLPDAPVDTIVVDPGATPSTGTIYVGTDVGVFSSPTGAANWTEVGPAPSSGSAGYIPSVPVTKLRIFSASGQKLLRASTYGRGIWQFPLIVTPDYQISIANTPQTIFPSQTATFNGTLTALNGYTNSVALSCTAGATSPPSTCHLSPTSLVPTATGSSFTLNAAGSLGDYAFNIHGVGSDTNTITHDAPVVLHIVDFSMTAPSPASVTANRPNSSNATAFQVTASGSFNQPVTLSCTGLPVGASCNFSPSSTVNPTSTSPANVSLTIGTTSATPTGSSVVTISASTSNPSATKTQKLTLAVTALADYTLAMSNPLQQSAPVTQSATFSGTLTSVNGYSTVVNLSCGSGAPSTCTFSPSASITPTAGGTAFTVTVQSQTSGNFSFNIAASSAGAATPSQSVPVTFASLPDFTLSATSSTATITAGGIASYTLNFAPAGSDTTFAQNVSYTCSLPANLNLTTCFSNPVSPITAGSPAGSVILSLRTTASVAFVRGNRFYYAFWIPLFGLVLAFGGFAVGDSRRRRFGIYAALGVILLLALLQPACGGGGGSGGPPPQPGTSPGTYTITVNASELSGSTTAQHSITLTLNVQ